MNKYKFWIDRGEQKSRDDLVSAFDFECEAEGRFKAQELFLHAKDQELLRLDDGSGIVVMMSCNDKHWHKVWVTKPPTIFAISHTTPVPVEAVYEHFEVDL